MNISLGWSLNFIQLSHILADQNHFPQIKMPELCFSVFPLNGANLPQQTGAE